MNSKQRYATPLIMGGLLVVSIAFLLVLAANAPKQVAGEVTNSMDPVSIATEVGLDLEVFNADRESSVIADRIKNMQQEGRKLSIDSTPRVFIEGKEIQAYQRSTSGALDYSPLFTEIDRVLEEGTDSVSLVEFFDYQCSYCAYLAPHIQEAKDRYKEKLNVTYMQYPILGENSVTLAYAAEAAREQGKFEEFHLLAFSKYVSLIEKQ